MVARIRADVEPRVQLWRRRRRAERVFLVALAALLVTNIALAIADGLR